MPAPPAREMVWAPKRSVLASDEVQMPIRLVNGEPYVDVDMGSSTTSFLIDTGGAGVVVMPKLADEEGLAAIGGGNWIDYAGGSVSDSNVHLLSMTIGGVRLDDLDAVIAPLQGLADDGASEVGGALGWPAFTDLLLTIDYPNRTVTFHRGELPPADGKEILPITRKDSGLFIPVSLNGTDLTLIVDTGTPSVESIVLTKNQGEGLKWCAPAAAYSVQNAFSSSSGKIGRVDGGLHIGRYVVQNPVAYVDDSRQMGLIGGGVLSNFTVTFDFRNMRLRLQRGSEYPIFAAGVGPDLTFHFHGNKVGSVVSGGLADLAGVRVGDEIVTANGKPMGLDGDCYSITNWPENQPLILGLRRGGQPITVVLNVKPLVR